MRRLLLNPALRGARVGKRNKTKAEWADVEEGAGGQPLIDPAEHQKFEAFIRGQMARRNVPDKRRQHVLAGKLTCGHCGGLMVRGTVTRSAHGRYFCRNQGCSWAVRGKQRNSSPEQPLLAAVLEAMADQAPAVAAAMERQAQARDEVAKAGPEVKKLQAKRRQYLALLADGDPVQPVIDQLDRQISALLEAGPVDGGGHLVALREAALRRARVTQVLQTSKTSTITEVELATALEASWRQQSQWAVHAGEAGIGPGVWQEIRELVRSAVVLERRLVSLDLNV